jgi:hypothetical protein
MRKEIDYRELFKRFGKPGERFDDDWIEYIDEKMSAQGQLIARHEWDSGGPGAGAGVVDVYNFLGLFFASDDGSNYGPYEGFTEAAEAVALLTVTDATTRIWVDYPEGRKRG